MTDAMTPEARAALTARIPLERLGTPKDVAGDGRISGVGARGLHHRSGARRRRRAW